MPTSIKDKHADEHYNSEAPYDQSIKKFLNDFSVVSLIQSIKAASRALRNSNYVDTELKQKMIYAILDGWDQISKVLFWLSPELSKEKCATYDGLKVFLLGNFNSSESELLDEIIFANPYNVVDMFKDDLSSMKIGPLVSDCLINNKSLMQKHFLSLFLITERPIGWYKPVFEFMNLLHRYSFIIGKLFSSINSEIENGFVSENDTNDLKMLLNLVAAKLEYASKDKITQIPHDLTINKKNIVPIDKIMSIAKKS